MQSKQSKARRRRKLPLCQMCRHGEEYTPARPELYDAFLDGLCRKHLALVVAKLAAGEAERRFWLAQNAANRRVGEVGPP